MAGVNSRVFKRGAQLNRISFYVAGCCSLCQWNGRMDDLNSGCIGASVRERIRGHAEFCMWCCAASKDVWLLSFKHACAGSGKLSQAEAAARRAAREVSSSSWLLLAAIGLALLLLWAKLLPHLPWLQQELTKWHSLSAGGAANARPT